MQVGDLVKYRKDLVPYMRPGYANRPVLVVEVGERPGCRWDKDSTVLVLTFEGLIRRRYYNDVELINASR